MSSASTHISVPSVPRSEHTSGSPAPFHVLRPGSVQQALVLRNVDRHHPHFYFGDGDLVLASSVVDFRVHIQELVPRSTILTYLFESYNAKPVEGIIYVPILGEDPDDWACLLGLIYEVQGNSLTCPTLLELMGVLRISERYGFARVGEWAAARLRADFFPNPQYFQDDPECSEAATEKLMIALDVIAASHHSRFETATIALAFYVVARRDPNSPATFQLVKRLSRQAWDRVLSGREVMERRFEEFGDKLIDVARVPRPTTAGHDESTCWEHLAQWAADARNDTTDVLKVVRQMMDETPPGPVCAACIGDARKIVEEEKGIIYHEMPIYFDFDFEEFQEYGWDMPEERKVYLSKSFRL